MKRIIRVVFCLVLSFAFAFAFAACNSDKDFESSKPEGAVKPATSESVDLSKLTQAESFAAKFAEYAFEAYEKGDNFTVAPVSVFMALSLAAECAAGDTRAEILSALGVSYDELKENFSNLYNSLEVEYVKEGKTTSLVDLSNSVWVNKGVPVKQPCTDSLLDNFNTSLYSVDFLRDNATANEAIRNFVKEQTRGLIDQDFELSEETVFTLINTLYLKTIWNTDGLDLSLTEKDYQFKASDGSVINQKLLQGYYNDGRVYEMDSFYTFYTSTVNSYKIKFILPKDGYSVDDIFTAQNIASVNALKNYNDYDRENNVYYETRCLFPEFKCSYDDDVKGILKEKFGIDKLFKDPAQYSDGCDFSSLSDESCYCSEVQHITDLTVDRKGIEGAAVTVMPVVGSAWREIIYSDFVIDKAFGFIITDRYDTTLFSGVVNKI